MVELSRQLIQMRVELGFRSTLKFFGYLETRAAVSINYAQYRRIEAGRVGATSDFVRKLSSVFPDYAERLIKSYCRDSFPEHSVLFESPQSVSTQSSSPPPPLFHAQEELSLRQVASISKSRNHYYLYLILTMARRGIPAEELYQVIKGLNAETLKEFTDIRLAILEDGLYRAVAIERKFPLPESPSLKSAYSRMDEWDLEFPKAFVNERLVKRAMIRRISPRYLPLLTRAAELLIDQFFAADESDSRRNVEAVSLTLDLRKFILPG